MEPFDVTRALDAEPRHLRIRAQCDDLFIEGQARDEIRQPFAVCFHATALPGVPRPDLVEVSDARWWPVAEVDVLPMQPAVRLRLHHALTEPDEVHTS